MAMIYASDQCSFSLNMKALPVSLILLDENRCPTLLSGQLYSLKKSPDLFPEDEDLAVVRKVTGSSPAPAKNL